MSENNADQAGPGRRWFAIGLVAVIAIGLIAAGLIYKSTTGTDQAKVDAALDRLDLATRGVNLDKQIGRVASSNLSRKRTIRQAEALREQATNLRTDATETDGTQQIVQGTDKAIRALDRLTRLASGIQKSEKIIGTTTKQNVNQLKINRKFLANLTDLSIGALLASSLTSYRVSIKDSIGDLEEEDSLPGQDTNESSPNDSLSQIDELKQDLVKVDAAPSKQINRLINTSKDQEYELLVTQAEADCGRTSKGRVVLLQAGEAICDELIAVVEKVNEGLGNGRYTAPAGWSCGTAPVTPSGNVGTFANGYGCTDGTVEISVFLDDARLDMVDQVAAEPVEPECPPGQEYSPAPHLQECVVTEGDESE